MATHDGGRMGGVLYCGECLCGAVRLEIAAEPFRVGICHCLDCRKHHGAIFNTFAVFPADAVSIIGTASDYRDRYVCPVCGSSVFSCSADEIEISADMSTTKKGQPAPNHNRNLAQRY